LSERQNDIMNIRTKSRKNHAFHKYDASACGAF
jgi:hypothetical protein